MAKTEAILDSSVVVAVLKIDDADHHKAVALLDKSTVDKKIHLLLPAEVLAESLNVIGKKLGKQQAYNAGNVLTQQISLGKIQLITSSVQLTMQALSIQIVATGNPSFIDALVMAYAESRKTSLILGFDSCFHKNGFSLP